MERILPVVRAEAFPHVKRPDRLRSLNSLAIGILASPTWADGQSGRTRPGEDQVRPLALTAVLG
jgi:hypothetical protein